MPLLYASALSIPNAWYFVALTQSIQAGKLCIIHLAGEEWVLWRGMDGQLSLQHAFCPHLGAHLGHGGTVQGNELRCPFHGFRFDGMGRCTASGYQTKPPQARLRSLPIQEKNGLIFAYWHAEGEAPDWEIPTLDMEGWSPFALHTWELRGHPQETTENSVDIGHFSWVHGYTDVKVMREVQMEGSLLQGRYSFRRALLRGQSWLPSLEEEIDFSVWGLGYTLVNVYDCAMGFRFRLLVMATAVETGKLALHIGISVLSFDRMESKLRFLPTFLLRPILLPFLLNVYRKEVEQDFNIWKHKTYMQPPALARGDGPVGMYRAWARRFY